MSKFKTRPQAYALNPFRKIKIVRPKEFEEILKK